MQTIEEEYTHKLNKDGSILFLYRSSAQLINQKIELDSSDLYDYMLDEHGNPKEFEYVPESNEYFLRIDNVPSDLFATYSIKIKDIVPAGSTDTPHERMATPPNNQPLLTMNHLDLQTTSIVQKKTTYIRTGTAAIPPYFKQPSASEIRDQWGQTGLILSILIDARYFMDFRSPPFALGSTLRDNFCATNCLNLLSPSIQHLLVASRISFNICNSNGIWNKSW